MAFRGGGPLLLYRCVRVRDFVISGRARLVLLRPWRMSIRTQLGFFQYLLFRNGAKSPTSSRFRGGWAMGGGWKVIACGTLGSPIASSEYNDGRGGSQGLSAG